MITLDMKGNLAMEKWKVKELKHGLMEIDMKVCGLMICNMVLDYSIMLKQIKKHLKNGEKVKDGPGIKQLSLLLDLLVNKKKDGLDEN